MMNMKDRIYIATMSENWRYIAEEYGLKLELDHFCQAQNMDGEQGEKTLAEVRNLTGDGGFGAAVLHGPFNELFPAAIDPQARALAMNRLNQAANTAVDLGIRKMVVHSGYIPFVYFREWHRDRSIEFWREFMEDKPADFILTIENVLDEDPYTMAEIAEGIGDERVGLCLDVGHANVVSELDIEEWIRVFGHHLKHVHLHNNDGSGDYHDEVFRGELPAERLMEIFSGSDFNDTGITLEVIQGRESARWLHERGYI
ncbi:MAG: TIM barrel protein [Firmicutes bacterium]|nr:TIM barrel protein [Bacillota bacterium]MDY2920107.1 TIM barrel protein [Lentihominibacter sp.]